MKHLDLEHRLTGYFGARQVFTLAKGRVALYTALKALGLAPGDEVIISGYTCMVVPSAVKFLGCTPRYADIDPRTYNMSPSSVTDLINSRTRAVVVQHTYGIPCRMGELIDIAQENETPLIEDCCLAFGGRFQGELLGTFGCASFLSGQWSKPFPTGLGGMLIINNHPGAKELAADVEALIKKEAIVPRIGKRALLRAQIEAYRLFVRPRTNLFLTGLYRLLAGVGIASGSSSPAELAGKMPADYFSTMTKSQADMGIKALAVIEKNISARKHNAAFYSQHLKEVGLEALQLSRMKIRYW